MIIAYTIKTNATVIVRTIIIINNIFIGVPRKIDTPSVIIHACIIMNSISGGVTKVDSTAVRFSIKIIRTVVANDNV